MCLIFFAVEDAKIEKTQQKPLLMGKKEGKNNIKIMKKIRLYFFSMLSHRKLMQR
jgi:hypothetical protein